MFCKGSASELFARAIFFPFDSFTFCTMCFDRVHPLQFFLDNPLIPTHIIFVCPPPHRLVCAAQIFLDVCSPTGVWSPYLGLLSQRTQPLLPQCPLQLKTATHSTPPSMLGFHLACACTGFGHAVAIPVNLFVHCPAISRCSFLVVTFSALVLFLLTLVE